VTLVIDKKLSNADLFVRYYILNPDLAYVSLWGDNDAISFTFAKKRGKWIFLTILVGRHADSEYSLV
jgi:hypothetical protein